MSSQALPKQTSNPVASTTPNKSKKSASAFRTISEVAEELDVQQHVLRFWETKFSQVRPLKRGGGRRYYRPEDVALLKKIHNLLYTEGYTIKGVQKLLREVGKAQLINGGVAKPITAPASAPIAPAAPAPSNTSVTPGLSKEHRSVLEDMLAELKELRAMVQAEG